MKGNLCLMKNPRFIESGRTAGNRLPSPGKVKKAVSKPATDLENGSPPFRVKKGVLKKTDRTIKPSFFFSQPVC